MKNMILPIVALIAASITGCSMITAWKSIPPPGGCDQCHTVAINNDWRISYQPPALSDESGRLSFQTPEYTMPASGSRAPSSLEIRKLQEAQCFECHNSPNSEHRNRKGRFHH